MHYSLSFRAASTRQADDEKEDASRTLTFRHTEFWSKLAVLHQLALDSPGSEVLCRFQAHPIMRGDARWRGRSGTW